MEEGDKPPPKKGKYNPAECWNMAETNNEAWMGILDNLETSNEQISLFAYIFNKDEGTSIETFTT